MSATACADKDLMFTRQDGLKWFRSSAEAQRGFCKECGSVLFWKQDGSDHDVHFGRRHRRRLGRTARGTYLLRECGRLLRDRRRGIPEGRVVDATIR